MNVSEEMKKAKLTGVVKAVKQVEGFGFISHTETGMDFFFHRSMMAGSPVPWEDVVNEMECEFIPVLDDDGKPKDTKGNGNGYRAAKVWIFE
jgi:cold shock CspA family protein